MKKRGSVFILALVVLVVATGALALTVEAQRQNFHSTLNRMEGQRARLMAESGIQRAVTELANVTQTGAVDQTGDWYLLGNQGTEKFTVGSSSFRIQILDASSLLDLNTATETELQNLNLTTSQIDSLLDWREAGEVARPEGAKDDYYNSLPKPYNCRKARLESLDETLLIKDWLPNTLYEVSTNSSSTSGTLNKTVEELCTVDAFSPNTDGSGGTKQNINNAQEQQLVQAGISQPVAQALIARRNAVGRFTTMNQVFQTPGLDQRAAGILLDRYTANAQPRVEGRLNLNTVTEDVLRLNPDFTSDIAQAIVSQQSSGFANLSEILNVPGITIQLLAQIADSITIGTDTFVVRSVGTAGSTTVSLQAVVRIDTAGPVILRIEQTPQNDMTTIWQWADTTSETVLAEEPQ